MPAISDTIASLSNAASACRYLKGEKPYGKGHSDCDGFQLLPIFQCTNRGLSAQTAPHTLPHTSSQPPPPRFHTITHVLEGAGVQHGRGKATGRHRFIEAPTEHRSCKASGLDRQQFPPPAPSKGMQMMHGRPVSSVARDAIVLPLGILCAFILATKHTSKPPPQYTH